MLGGFDHVVVAVRAMEPSIEAYRTLLGRAPSWRAAGEGGVAVAMFGLANVTVELMAPVDEGPIADRLRTILDTQGEGLTSLAFMTADLKVLHARMQTVGLDPEPITPGDSFDAFTGNIRTWRRTRVGASAAHGLRLFALERDFPVPFSAPDAGVAQDAAVAGVDHIVVRSPNPDRAAALFGARLGLSMRMDQAFPAFGARLSFYRCGDAILEIASPLPTESSAGDLNAPDQLWGLTYRVPDAEAAHSRLKTAGLDVSPVREGRKPGTKVFTVRSGTGNVPTLMLQAAKTKAASRHPDH